MPFNRIEIKSALQDQQSVSYLEISNTSSIKKIKAKRKTPIWDQISEYITITSSNNYFNTKRNKQNKFWLIQTIEAQL